MEDENVTIYPNPTDGMVNISARNINEVGVYNLVGQEIETFVIDEDQCIIDMSDYNDGVYFVKVKTENEIITKKIILTN